MYIIYFICNWHDYRSRKFFTSQNTNYDITFYLYISFICVIVLVSLGTSFVHKYVQHLLSGDEKGGVLLFAFNIIKIDDLKQQIKSFKALYNDYNEFVVICIMKE